jgi:hypothetical protein
VSGARTGNAGSIPALPPVRPSTGSGRTGFGRTRWTLLALTAAVAAGCAGPRVARLRYPAPPPAAFAPASRPLVALQRLLDARPAPHDVVGVARTGAGGVGGAVTTRDDAAAWATGALRIELERVGFTVVGEGALGVPVVGGELLRAFCDARVGSAGRVELRAWVKRGDAYPLDRNVDGRGSAGFSPGPTAAAFERCLSRAMGDAAARTAAAVRAAL